MLVLLIVLIILRLLHNISSLKINVTITIYSNLLTTTVYLQVSKLINN